MTEEKEIMIQYANSDVDIVHGGRLGIFEQQAPATLNKAVPVQNTWNQLLPATESCRVYALGINIEDANETLQVRITIDGIISTFIDITATHSTPYFIRREMNAITRTAGYAEQTTPVMTAFLCEGKSVSIEIRKTTAAGAGNLTAICEYGVLKDAG